VDDGSTDQTFAVARAIAARDERVRVIRSQPNHGKGHGVRTGMLQARGELLVFTDADGSYGPGEVARVAAALAHAPVAIGSRPAGWATGQPAGRLAGRPAGQPTVQPCHPSAASSAVPRHPVRLEGLSPPRGA
jgi:glycosyltransferase involved in cell wall biosynthesis